MNFACFSEEQSAGQRLMVGFDGTDLNRDLKFLIDTVKVGGVILFSRNLLNPAQIKDLCGAVQAYAAECGQPPLFIAIDQEGGQVARLKPPFTQFPGNPNMRDAADAVHFAQVTVAELKSVGINMNMAPVMDIAPKDMQSIMAGRAFGGDPERVSELGVTVIETMQRNGIPAVAKHFPGIGRTVPDSHHELPVFGGDMADLETFDLLPFQAAIRCGVSGIMLSHILYEKIDPELPASLSPAIAKTLLRDRLCFEGLVMTDDLDMGAVRKHYDLETAVRQILLSETDIALICHKGPDIENAFETILRETRDSAETKAKGELSVRRILGVKQDRLI